MSYLVAILPILLGFLLDLILGDPQGWPHPVRWIGSSITSLQKFIRNFCVTDRDLKWGGLCLWLVIVSGTFAITWLLLYLVSLWSWWLNFFLTTLLTYNILATKCLKDAAIAVYQVLKLGTLQEARTQLSYIVGRDTQHLDEQQISRAVVETVAENTVDGVIAPLFYLFIGGVPLALAYKAINTLDSMVGYQTPKYKAIGYVSAKMDDLFNYIPARFSWLLLSMAAAILKLNGKDALFIGWRDRYQHKSPNCAWSEATVAGALGVRLGGPNNYFGELVEKPWIGDEKRNIKLVDIKTTIYLMYVSAVLALLLFTTIYLIVSLSIS